MLEKMTLNLLKTTRYAAFQQNNMIPSTFSLTIYLITHELFLQDLFDSRVILVVIVIQSTYIFDTLLMECMSAIFA